MPRKEESTTRHGNFTALKQRDFALLWWGQSVSQIGDGIFTIAIALEALRLTHRPSGFALVVAARMIPSVVLMLASGVIVDRVSRQSAMLVSDVARALTVGVVALLTATGHVRLYELVTLSVIFGVADSFFGPASTALMPELLESELLVQGNALMSTSQQLASGFLGPAFGGAIGTAWAFGCDAISFVLSAGSLALMHRRPRKTSTSNSFMDDAREGVHYLRTQRWLLIMLVAAGLINLIGYAPIGILVPLLVRQSLHATAFELGVVLAMGGIGGVVASLVVGRLATPRHQIVVLWIAYAAAAVPICVMSLSATVWLVAVCVVFQVGLVIYGDVLFFSMLQKLVPENLLGRVSSVLFLLAVGLMPLGTLLAGVFATIAGIRPTLFVCGASSLLCLFVPLLPGVRDPEILKEPVTSEAASS